MNLSEIAAWLNKTYPTRDWDQQCQRLVWNVVHLVSGTPEAKMHTYQTATDARLASKIESTDALKAPVGAIHYWKNPAEGHVAVELGGGQVLMTGTQSALTSSGKLLGKNYGTTTVAAYTKARGNPYLGWARTNGKNASIIDKITTSSSPASGGSKVKHYSTSDPSARGSGRTLNPGGNLYLNTKQGAKDSNASNVAGGVGPYSITPHIYASGEPGEGVELVLIWQDTKANPPRDSWHYVERLIFDKEGLIRASREFKRYVSSGHAVYVRVEALRTNTEPVKITLLDCDSYLYV